MRKTLLALSLAALMLPSAQALDLLQAWQAAQAQDRGLAVAQAVQQAAEPRREQAAALWRPSVQLQAGVGRASQDSRTQGAQFSAPALGSMSDANFNTSISKGSSTRWALQASQPLYDPARRAQAQQLGLSAELAEQQWRAALQELMLQTAQRYYALALADERVRLLARQLVAVEKAAAEAQERFKLGASPVLDSHEGLARLAALKAEHLAAQTEALLQRRLLADSTGLPPEPLQAQLPARAPEATAALETWLERAERDSPALRLRQLAVQLARQEAGKHRLEASPRVELVAQAGRDRLSGSGDFGSGAAYTGSQQAIAVQLTLPLYTGGLRSAREREALAQLAQAEAELALARQQTEQALRASWLTLQAGQLRLQALAEALQASERRRDATQLGREVGDRTLLDQLNAENDSAQARLALAQARVAQQLELLRLAASSGCLDEAVLERASTAGAETTGRNAMH